MNRKESYCEFLKIKNDYAERVETKHESQFSSTIFSEEMRAAFSIFTALNNVFEKLFCLIGFFFVSSMK